MLRPPGKFLGLHRYRHTRVLPLLDRRRWTELLNAEGYRAVPAVNLVGQEGLHNAGALLLARRTARTAHSAPWRPPAPAAGQAHRWIVAAGCRDDDRATALAESLGAAGYADVTTTAPLDDADQWTLTLPGGGHCDIVLLLGSRHTENGRRPRPTSWTTR
ncbi:hypothetical protein ACQEVS_30800 [Streptomyces sp. CA-181903]|uniref:hypothetical protein n=1 Tax=Streptomyces sp. CA-181903 TaxID=3240055 RepID=UPI003D9151FD